MFKLFNKKFIFIAIFYCIASLAKDYELKDKMIAIAEKEAITISEIHKEIEKKYPEINSHNLPDNQFQEIWDGALQSLITKKLITQYAENIKINVSKEEVDFAISGIIKSNNISLEILEKDLINQNSSINEFRDEIQYQLLIRKIKDREIMPYVNISEYEIDALLKKEEYDGDTEYKLSHILIKNENPKKDAIQNMLRENNLSFKAIAKDYSDGPNAEAYGDLGWNKLNEIPNIFINFVKKAKVEEISGPIESSNGIHFLKLEEVRNSKKIELIKMRQYKFQQILLKNNAISSNEETEKKLINIKNLILDGLDFNEAVKLYSEDKFNLDPNKLQWVDHNNLLPEFTNNINNSNQKDMIGPFKTEVGWHLVKIYNQRENDITSLAIREKAKIEIARKKTELRFEDWLQALKQNSRIKIFKEN